MTGSDDADALAGQAHERGLDRARRKRDGVFYTPGPVVAAIVDDALGRVLQATPPGPPIRIVDPACGAGAFLIAAYRALLGWHTARRGPLSPAERRQLLETSIFGVDIDETAVRLTRQALARLAGGDGEEYDPIDMSRNIRRGNALLGADAPAELGAPLVWEREFSGVFAAGGFSLVLGNPPFVDAEAMTRHHAALRRHCAGRYRAARGNWDLFCVFIELGLRLCAPGGVCAMIVPNKLASADYAAAARELLTREARLCAVYDLSEAPVFAAGVYPLAFVARRVAAGAEAPAPVTVARMAADGSAEAVRSEMSSGTGDPALRGPWPIFGRGERGGRVAHLRAVGRPLGELAEVWGAATVAEAYAIAGLIGEGESGLRVVNSGTIDRCEALWGRAPLRYLGRSFLRPVIVAVEQLPPRRLQQARTPKVIVAGMTRTLEAIVDLRGEFMAAKSTTICWWPADLRLLLAILHSRAVDDYYQQVHGGDRLARGYLRIGPRQIRQIPVPDPRRWDAGVSARICALVDAWIAGDRGAAAAIDGLVDGLYGL